MHSQVFVSNPVLRSLAATAVVFLLGCPPCLTAVADEQPSRSIPPTVVVNATGESDSAWPGPRTDLEDRLLLVPTVEMHLHAPRPFQHDPEAESPGQSGPVKALHAPAREYPNIRVNTDSTTQLQNEEKIAVNPLDGNNLVGVWRDFRLGYRQVGVGYSFDGGLTWNDSLFTEPNYPRQSDPDITVDASGNFYAIVLSYTGSTSDPNGLFVSKSSDGGVTWGSWVPVIDGAGPFEDKEFIACDRSGGTTDGNLYVVWARFSSIITVQCSRSWDGGASYQGPVRVSDSDYLQFPVPAVDAGGLLHVAWVDLWNDRIMMDTSTDGGVTFGTDRALVNLTGAGLLYLNGNIGVFKYPAMDTDVTDGPYRGSLYMAYPDETHGDMDIFFRRSSDGGNTWSLPLRVNDDLVGNGRDQFHPWITVDADGSIAVAFLDRRDDPANYLYHCYVARSTNGGASFEPNVRASDTASDPNAGSSRAELLGEYIGVASYNGRINPLYTDTRNGHQDAYTAVVNLGTSDTILAGITCQPASGTVPFSTGMVVTLTNLASDQTRRIAGHLDVALAGGQQYSNWKAGWSNVNASSSFDRSWNQAIPALGSTVGDNVFELVAEDVTPPPYNQPPYPAAGDTATDQCTVTGVAP